jgi:hypothetical protein
MTCCAGTTSEEQTSRVVLARSCCVGEMGDGRWEMGGMDGVGDMSGMEAQQPTWKRDTASCNYDHN